MSTTMTIRLDDALKARLDQLAQLSERSRSYLAVEAIKDYVAHNEWQMQELVDACKEADANDFADDQELNNIFGKWDVNAG